MSNSPTWRRYQAAIERTAQLSTGESPDTPQMTFQERAEHRLDQLREMLDALGNPLSATPIVHVAGTSGKGSTATAIASILTSAGYRTGLHTSPYVQGAIEKLQIDRELIDGRAFARLVDDTIDRLEQAGFQPSYGQLWTAMVLAWFEQESVDIAVIEVGAGGRFDLTNVIHPIVSVITEIGLDHTETLGSTIEAIAWHKAGIIKPFTPAVAAISDRAALRVVAGAASELGADLHHIVPARGDFHRTNEATAKRAVELLDFDISSEDIEDGLAQSRIPGRFERVQLDPVVILDGAHNPQKIAALAAWYAIEYPRTHPVVVAGFLETKDARAMLQALGDLASALILTEPVADEKPPACAERLAEITRDLAFHGPVHIESDPRAATALAIDLARRTSQPLLVTGSLYLAGNVRGRWYPDESVLLQRTSWPQVNAG